MIYSNASCFFRILELWKTELKSINEKAADALADPQKYPNLFPDLEWGLKVINKMYIYIYIYT